MKFENTEVFNFEGALRGMRNPMNSWDKSDSEWIRLDEYIIKDGEVIDDPIHFYKIGDNDMKLVQKLICAGSEHRKFLRQIFVSVDVTAPMYWWNEFDTYKVGTVANSTSKMHKLASTPITMDCFEMDDFDCCIDSKLGYLNNNPCVDVSMYWYHTTGYMERLRRLYNETKDKKYWKELIRLLPESWLQRRTVTMNYENVLNMYHQRKNHKLNEWSGKDDPAKPNFCTWVLELPYAKQFFIEPFEKRGTK